MGKDERKIEAFELYKQGLSLVDIARKIDVPEGTIAKHSNECRRSKGTDSEPIERMKVMLEEPRCIMEGYAYIDEKTEKWCIKEDAPDWAKKEFSVFFGTVAQKPDDNDIVTAY